MNDEQRARTLLQQAGDEISVRPPRAHAVIADARHLKRRRAMAVTGGVAAVCLVAAGGTLLGLHVAGSDEAASQTSDVRVAPVINTAPTPANYAMQARVGGRLAISKGGCLILRAKGKVTDLFWPYGYTAERGADGKVSVKNPAGRVVLRQGWTFWAGGGYVRIGDLDCRASSAHSDVGEIDGPVHVESR